jgi:type I restriction enzyme S subunit
MSQDLYDLPEGWEWKRLGDVAHTTSGGTPSRGKSGYWNGDIPWIKSGELGDSLIVSNSEFITEEGLKNSSAKIFEKGSLLLALYGATAGKLGVLDFDAATNQAVCCISPRDDFLFRDYIKYFLFSKREKIIKDSFGGAQPNISQGYVRDIIFPLPPLAEQIRIVEKLDAVLSRIDTAIDELQQSLALVDAMFKSGTSSILSCNNNGNWLSIEEVFSISSGKNLTSKQLIDDGKYPVYGGNGITGHYNNFNLEGVNIVIGRVGALCGNVRLISEKIWLTDNAFYIKNLIDGVSKEYLAILLGFMELGKTANQAAQPVISYKSIKELDVFVPSIEQQHNIVFQINGLKEKTTQLKTELTAKIGMFNQLKASVLDGAFRGEV